MATCTSLEKGRELHQGLHKEKFSKVHFKTFSHKIWSSLTVSSNTKTDNHDIPVIEILLKVALNTYVRPYFIVCRTTRFLLLLQSNTDHLQQVEDYHMSEVVHDN